jgi:hypothetical protein
MRTSTRRAALTALSGLLAGLVSMAPSVAQAANPVSPGPFTGYGFDQCLAPTQKSMNAWLQRSPFLAVGIYISGDSRACRSQPNLTPDWVATQQAKGWRLLPITLGPQASCNPRFPRYRDDTVISPRPGRHQKYRLARAQGRAEADSTVADATALGIAKGSTLWYDLEGFDLGNRDCRESSLAFLSAWTTRLHATGWVSGAYSSAGSGIKMLDDARVERPDAFALPDQIWVARWDGKANTSVDTAYLRDDGWRPGGRMKQYQGGHDETWGGVTINIDRDYLDLAGEETPPVVHCNGVAVDQPAYTGIAPGTTQVALVRALKCLLSEQGAYAGRMGAKFGDKLLAATEAWQTAHGFAVSETWNRSHWMSLLAQGTHPVLKLGSTGEDVRRLQRTLDAALVDTSVPIDGRFGAKTDQALRAYQKLRGQTVTGIVVGATWKGLRAGQR